MPRPKRKAKPKRKSVSTLKKRADLLFSRWVRNRDRAGNGVRCYTCGVIKPFEEMQAGHYVSRGYNALRYHEKNVHAQCLSCNVFRHGAMDEYATALIRQYGPEVLTEFRTLKRQVKQFKAAELQTIIDSCNEELR